jgi:hypothetical protein
VPGCPSGSVAKDQRELKDKQPAIDVQIRPAGISNLSVTIFITNRADIDRSPLDIVAENSVEAGSLNFANDRQSIDKLSSSLSLTSMGPIVPKGRSPTEATLSGVTDGRFEQFRPGLELEFTVRIRFADQKDTIEQISNRQANFATVDRPPSANTGHVHHGSHGS